MSFIDKLFVDYPIPKSLSCWGSLPGVQPVEDINLLISTSVDEIASDILITGFVEAAGMITYMPEGTVTCTSAMLSSIYPFQGNRLVKVTYDAAANRAYLRYYPATITYQRKLRVSDLESLSGDRLIYIKSFCFWKMADKDLSILKTAKMDVDNGSIDLSVLEKFREDKFGLYSKMKEEILLYATVN